MVTEYIRYRLPPERLEGFEAAYAQAAESLRAAPECVDFDLSRCVEEPASYSSFQPGKVGPPQAKIVEGGADGSAHALALQAAVSSAAGGRFLSTLRRNARNRSARA